MLEKGSTCRVHAWLVAKGELARALLLQQELPAQPSSSRRAVLALAKTNFQSQLDHNKEESMAHVFIGKVWSVGVGLWGRGVKAWSLGVGIL